MSKHVLIRVPLAVATFALLSPVAYSHTGAHVDSIAASFAHLVGGVDHLLFFVAVGLFVSLARVPFAFRSIALVAAVALAAIHLGASLPISIGAIGAAGTLVALGFGIGTVAARLRTKLAI